MARKRNTNGGGLYAPYAQKPSGGHGKTVGQGSVNVNRGEKVDLYSQFGYDETVGRQTRFVQGRTSGAPAYYNSSTQTDGNAKPVKSARKNTGRKRTN